MLTIELDKYQTLAVAAAVLLLGDWLKKKLPFLERFCIPSPVAGGLVFAVFTCVLYELHIAELEFDDVLREVCMVLFFTSVGFQANLKVLKSGGKSLIVFLILVIILIIAQNVVAVGTADILHVDRLLGLCTGSIPMVGGHGTAGAFGPILEDFGVTGATTICTAAATFGLIAGSLIGGPIGNGLIKKYDLLKTVHREENNGMDENKKSLTEYPSAAMELALTAGIGTVISDLLSRTGMTFPIYIGAMITAAVWRNIAEYTGKLPVHIDEINSIGDICLSLFLGIAMITLKIWQLADLALPLIVLLLAQLVFMYIYARYVIFNIMGKDYDAAVIAAGTCGFGMGATPNAMANMQALTEKYGPSLKAFILIPIVGSLFADFINSLVITSFINIL